ncbi:MAG: SDR family NAD(P)-dependent oxidoreductase [Gemmatimonadetes bacterium]|nr:SDR family oxidoreductase [Gemmatimonadota bacterium]NIQ58372.1 SDR family oxidoreductase [Gemmatimonadota bacterium]NIU78588.1 SDR family NAD(P)-dependent oxidoreductase [Gammaproteobacteria bacterium]NIX47428.1 SDR family NAD(P)-dependent oxidoreductase [Gemmatimonadota bacterium]NIY11811.1 SDR family NAD(P)-dependent oxidoreductase [Gemmatimonadota bacterium]
MPSPRSKRPLAGRRVLATGATGGLGPVLVEALADAGASLALSALPGPELDGVAARVAPRVEAGGGRVAAVPTDLLDPEAPASVVERTVSALGGVDVLVHNAGLERVGRFEAQAPESLDDVVRVNLLAAMHLSRRVLPGMLSQGWGRLVFVASLSGKTGPAYTGAYAASKAGLVVLARTLRAEYRGRGVSATAVVPGFVRDVGMYARGRKEARFRGSWILGTVRPEAVARAVIRATDSRTPEILVQPGPTRLALALGELLPGALGQRLSAWAGVDRLFREWSEARLGPDARRSSDPA